MQDKPQWMMNHEEADNKRFDEINEKLDSILEVMSAFKLGGKGVMGLFGFLIAIGTVIALTMQILHK